MRQKFVSRSVQETKQLGLKLAKSLREGGILALSGELGSGKTTFLKGLAKGLGIKQPITSPTFVICRPYLLPSSSKTFFHFDLYRLKNFHDLRELGLSEILKNPKAITAIEWPEKTKKFLSSNTLHLRFSLGKSSSERIIELWSKKSLSF